MFPVSADPIGPDAVFVSGTSVAEGATANNGDRGVTATDSPSIMCSRPLAAFFATPTYGLSPLTVAFTDTSTNHPRLWSWDFGDGKTSTARNPMHVYTQAGRYTVILTVSNEFGSDDEIRVHYIRVMFPVIPFPGSGRLPTDIDGDSLYEDTTGNGIKDANDVVLFFKNLNWTAVHEPVAAFDFNGNGVIDTNDVVVLFKRRTS